MGVVNVTPDSFSDGGEWFEPDAAIAHGRRLLADGADLLDVGGESTRPGAGRVDEAEELRRVLPVIRELAREGAVVSVDTTRAAVAERALDAGAAIVNDVSGGLADPAMGRVVADSGALYVAMHWRGHADVMDAHAHYVDVVRDVRDELAARLDALVALGVDPGQVVLDPGLGFAKPGTDNWPILANLDVLEALGQPVLVGASRKRFLGHLLAGDGAEPVPPGERDAATAAITTLCAARGVWCVRVHDARGSADAVRVVARWQADVRASGTDPATDGRPTAASGGVTA
jgi:dihydropteroate synthase